MPFRPDGTFQRNMNWQNDAAADIDILADRHDNEDDNFAAGLSETITKSGKSQPTADIPMNGKRLINLGAPVNNTDAANKAYADSVRNFSTAATISGNDVQGRLKFTGTGTTGLEFATADIGFGARVGVADTSWHRFAFNTAADLTGSDVVTITDQGHLGVGLVPPLAATTSSIIAGGNITADQQFCVNAYLDTSGKWRRVTSGWAALFQCLKADGRVFIYHSSATGAADSEITWQAVQSYDTALQVVFPSNVYAGAAYLVTNGNVVGTLWATWGANDAYTAISARIESRAAAYAANKVGSIAMTSETYVDATSSGAGPRLEPGMPWVATGIQKIGGDNYRMWFRALQYEVGGGWNNIYAR